MQKRGEAHETSLNLAAAGLLPIETGVVQDVPLYSLAIPFKPTAKQNVTVGHEITPTETDEPIEPRPDQDRPLNLNVSPDAESATHELFEEHDTETNVVPPVTLLGSDQWVP